MSDSAAAPVPLKKSNSFSRMAGVLVSPVETMREIVWRPDFLIPLLFIVIIGLATSVIVAPHLDMRSSLQPMLEKQGMKPEMQERAIEMAEKFKQFAAPIGAVSNLVNLLIIAAVFFGVFKLMGSAGTFGEFFSVTIYSWFPQIISGLLATLLVLRKGSITTEEMLTLVKSNLAFTTSQVASPALFTLFNSIDLFNFWTVTLLTIGLSFSSRFPRWKSAALVVGVWMVSVLVRVGFASLQGGPH